MAWNADFSGLSFLEESSKPKQEQEGLKKCRFFSNREKMQLVYRPTNSSKVIQFLFLKNLYLLYIPKKNTCFPWSAGSTLSTKLFSARLWTSTTQWPARKSPQPWFFGGKSQGLEGVPTVELWVTLAFAPSWLNWEPPLGGVERVWPRKFLDVESWGSWCFNGNWELGGFSTQPRFNLHRFKTTLGSF